MFDAAYEAAEEPTVLLRLHVLSFRDGRFCFEAKVSYNYKLFLMNYYLITEKDIFLNSLEMISCYFMHLFFSTTWKVQHPQVSIGKTNIGRGSQCRYLNAVVRVVHVPIITANGIDHSTRSMTVKATF